MQRCKDIWNSFQKRGRNNEDGDDADVTPVAICIDWDFLLNLCSFYLYLYRFFYLLETFLQFHNTHLHCICCLKNEGRKKAKKKKMFRKILRGFIFVNLPFPKFSRRFILANRRLSNISREFNFGNLSKIRENREYLSARN